MTEVSVIIPARNAAMTIGGTLESLLSDRSIIGEVLLIDDGSEDKTARQATHCAALLGLNLKVHFVSYSSPGASRNHGIKNAAFPYLYFIDADDSLIPGQLKLLHGMLVETDEAGIALGGSIRETPARRDLQRIPNGYGNDAISNAELYLKNGASPIAIGSGLVDAKQSEGIYFPDDIRLDEDTWYWSALLARIGLVTTSEPVLRYKLDERRSASRFLHKPVKQWQQITTRFQQLKTYGVSPSVLEFRAAWLAQRFARLLIKERRYREAHVLLEAVSAHRNLARQFRTLKYRAICFVGNKLRNSVTPQSERYHGSPDWRTMVVSHDPSYPPVSGADIRNFRNARLASRMGEVALASLRECGAKQASSEIELVSLNKHDDRKSKSINSNRIDGEPRISRIALERLLIKVRTFQPRTIILEGVFLRALIPHLRRASDATIITDMHNVESDLAHQLDTDTPNTLSKNFRRWRLRKIEGKALKQSDKIWVCTETDRNRLIQQHGIQADIEVVPNGAPHQIYDCSKPAKSFANRPNILFVGHLGYEPNAIAARRLARELLPSICAEISGVTLRLAGRYPRQDVQDLAMLPNVSVEANPKDLTPFFQSADLVVVPLQAGGGSRIKIIEAAYAGVPVVASSIAAEGLAFLKELEILIANTDEEFVAASVRLLKSKKLRAQLSQAAFATCCNLYLDRCIEPAFRHALGANGRTITDSRKADQGYDTQDNSSNLEDGSDTAKTSRSH